MPLGVRFDAPQVSWVGLLNSATLLQRRGTLLSYAGSQLVDRVGQVVNGPGVGPQDSAAGRDP